jgi:hypothetical protein
MKHIKGKYAGVTLCGWGVSELYFTDWAHEGTILKEICAKCKKARAGKIPRK